MPVPKTKKSKKKNLPKDINKIEPTVVHTIGSFAAIQKCPHVQVGEGQFFFQNGAVWQEMDRFHEGWNPPTDNVVKLIENQYVYEKRHLENLLQSFLLLRNNIATGLEFERRGAGPGPDDEHFTELNRRGKFVKEQRAIVESKLLQFRNLQPGYGQVDTREVQREKDVHSANVGIQMINEISEGVE